MNIRKKICTTGLCCLLLSSFLLKAHDDDIDFDNSLDIETVDSDRDDSELSLDDIDDNILEAAFQSRPETRESSPVDILTTLYSLTGINRILKHDLYNCTYPLPTRNIITYPTLFYFTPNQTQLGLSFFYQQTTNMFPWCNNIEGYLNLYDPTVMREIDLEIAQQNGIDIPRTISLLKNARVEQRRVGFFFNVWKKFNWFNIGLELPFYAVERNYNLPPEDIKEIEAADVFEKSDNQKTEKKAIHQYVLETRLGIGDTRLTLGFDVVNCDRGRLVLGTKLTFPTVATFTSGFVGSDFKEKVNNCNRGYLNLEELIEKFTEGTEAEKEEAKDEATNFGIKAVNQMGALLLSTQLGSKRFQAAGYVEPTFHVDNQVTVVSSFRVNWLAPYTTARFIKETTTPSDFDDDNFDPDSWEDPEDQARAEAQLQFLNNRLRNWLFPCCYRLNLKAQQEYQFTIAALFNLSDNWNWKLGYDWWHKTGEQSGLAKYDGSIVNNNCIQTCAALQPYASQQKIFTKFEYTKFKESHDFVFRFGADFPLINKNIGDDFTAVLDFEWVF